ncbi:MAG: ATP-binding protein [Chloroflexi bacterium]|nr:ATP-binding protein [Chloroflexota bacterium]
MADRQAEMRLMLRNLRMPAIAALYEDLAIKAAKANLTHEAFLYELVRAECLQREEHRVARLQRLSGLPPDKTFRTLQLDKFPPLIREQLERLRSGAFLEAAVNLVAAGKPGVGKSHALAAIGNELVLLGHPVLWTPTATLVQELLAAKRDLRLPHALAKLDRFDCVFLDDIGYVQHDRDEMEVLFTFLAPHALAKLDRFDCVFLDDIGYVQHDRDEMEVLFTFLAERYERRSVAISTNLVFSDWNRIFKDPMTTMAAIDRVVHHSVILDLMGMDSYRAREATLQHTLPPPPESGPASDSSIGEAA